MRVHPSFVAALLSCAAASSFAQAPASASSTSRKAEPTKAQTEEWLKEHIEAWNEGEIVVKVQDCRVVVLDRKRERTEVIDLRGLLLPIEVIRTSPGAEDATIRLRVKQKHSGTFGMFRKCDQQNRYCEDGAGKFERLPFIDLTITYVRDYRSTPQSLTSEKAGRLEDALEHYSRLCGAMEDARNRLF